MMSRIEEVRDVLRDNIDTIILYTHNSLVNEDRVPYRTVSSYELDEYIDRVTSSIGELIYNKQFELTVDTIKFMLEYEMIGLTSEPHKHKCSEGFNELAKDLFELYNKLK